MSTDVAMATVQSKGIKMTFFNFNFLSILTSEMKSTGINQSPYQFLRCFINKLLRYSPLKLSAFRQNAQNFKSMTSLSMTSVQISKFYLVRGIVLS